jgi:hypothetical protein
MADIQAYEEGLRTITRPVSADLSASQFCFVKGNSDGELALAADGGKATGVLQTKPSAQGQAGDVAIAGVTKVQCGGSFDAGDDIASNSTGQAVKAGTGDVVLAEAMTSGGSGVIGSVLLKSA